MADIDTSLSSPVFAIDRAPCAACRDILVGAIKFHTSVGTIVQVEDSSQPRSVRLCYKIRPSEAALHLFDAHGRQIGVFANIAALVAHAEAVTGV